jgi:hypothetical protein
MGIVTDILWTILLLCCYLSPFALGFYLRIKYPIDRSLYKEDKVDNNFFTAAMFMNQDD